MAEDKDNEPKIKFSSLGFNSQESDYTEKDNSKEDESFSENESYSEGSSSSDYGSYSYDDSYSATKDYSFDYDTGNSEYTNSNYSNYTNTESTLKINLDDLGFGKSQAGGKNQGSVSDNRTEPASGSESNVGLQFNIEKPDDDKVKKYSLFGAILFFIIVLPIMYHNIRDIYYSMQDPGYQQKLEVETETFKKENIYTQTEATGLITPASSVDVVARVDGYLQKTFFKEGDFIRQGQLLFKIEPNEYEIAVRAAKASVDQTRAVYDNSLQELERAKELIKENFISRSDYDGIVATANRDKAALDEVNQSLARAQLNLNYTNIYSPLTGKAGKIALSDGNYVGLSSGPLVNIAKTNPICVSFSMKSADVIKLKQANNGVLDLSTAKVEIILSDDSVYDKVGKINFSDNIVAEDAATLSLKAVFDNPDNILVPGDYVKVIITPATPINTYLVPQYLTHGDALNGYYLWSYKDGKTKKLPITVAGSRDNFWIVADGLTDADQVIVKSNLGIDYEGAEATLKNKPKNN